MRDEGALESALGRPINCAAYGNERAALLGLVTFLGLNAVDVLVDEAEAVVMIRCLAAGEIDEAGLTRWIRDNWPVA